MFKFIRFLYASTSVLPIKNQFIKNVELPVCKACVHFKFYDANNLNYTLGKCEKFGNKNIVSGEITYVFAESCRIGYDQCGKTGKYFEKNL